MVFSSSHVWMWELDYKESWVPKNWCFWTVVLEETRESPLDCKIKPTGNQPWLFTGIFIGRTDVEAEAPTLWPPDAKSYLIGKRPWCKERLRAGGKGVTEDEMVGWHHWLNGYGFDKLQEIVQDRKVWRAAVHGVAKSLTQLGDWTRTTKWLFTKQVTCGFKGWECKRETLESYIRNKC